jgi:zinc-binding alcohol dehydrogenase family protein
MFEAMGRAIAASGIKPMLDKVFPFDEAQAAYRHMASGAHFGKSLSAYREQVLIPDAGRPKNRPRGTHHPVAPREEGVGAKTSRAG